MSNKKSALHDDAAGGVSKKVLFLVGSTLLIVGFVLGTRADEFGNFLGPFAGLNKSSDKINLSSIQNTYQFLKKNFDGKLDEKALIEGANHGLVEAAGDKYTVYFDHTEAEEFAKDLNGDVGAGIGAEISVRNSQPTVVRVMPGNPAERVGIKAGDIIVAVNDESAKGWDASMAASKMRGKEGTSVKVSVSRGEEVLDFTITREKINNPSVVSEVREGIGILTVRRFDGETSALTRRAAGEFKQQGVRGIILDVRGDGGGYIDAAVDVAGLWLQDKLVVTQRRDGKTVDVRKSHGEAILAGVPTVVLTDEGTASASEIVAGSLRDHKAATILGQKTFGKGSVQQLLDIGNGSQLKVTVARWYTPNNINIDHQGLKPDVEVKLEQKDLDAGLDPQLETALQRLH